MVHGLSCLRLVVGMERLWNPARMLSELMEALAVFGK